MLTSISFIAASKNAISFFVEIAGLEIVVNPQTLVRLGSEQNSQLGETKSW